MDSNLRKNLQTDKGYIHEEKLWENTYIRHQEDRRKEGGHFSVEMHIRGMVYAMFGSKIPWKCIKHDIDTKTGIMYPVDDIFHNYNAEILLKCDTDELADALKEIGCKGKSVRVLVDALIKYNIPKLLDFEEKYGIVGKDFIHVHHIVPLNTIGEEYLVDYEKDLMPVCPNCHAMLHRKVNGKELTVEELKELLNSVCSLTEHLS